MMENTEVPHFDCSKRRRNELTSLRGKAVLRADTKTRDLYAGTLAKRGVPVQNRLRPGDYDPLANSVKVMTMKVSKGLEFPVVAIQGVEWLEHMGAKAAESGGARRRCQRPRRWRAGRRSGCCMRRLRRG